MKVVATTSHRARLQCEHCGSTRVIKHDGLDEYDHQTAIPGMPCLVCGKTRAGDFGFEYVFNSFLLGEAVLEKWRSQQKAIILEYRQKMKACENCA